jgi:hypothetical protein
VRDTGRDMDRDMERDMDRDTYRDIDRNLEETRTGTMYRDTNICRYMDIERTTDRDMDGQGQVLRLLLLRNDIGGRALRQ